MDVGDSRGRSGTSDFWRVSGHWGEVLWDGGLGIVGGLVVDRTVF